MLFIFFFFITFLHFFAYNKNLHVSEKFNFSLRTWGGTVDSSGSVIIDFCINKVRMQAITEPAFVFTHVSHQPSSDNSRRKIWWIIIIMVKSLSGYGSKVSIGMWILYSRSLLYKGAINKWLYIQPITMKNHITIRWNYCI